MSAIDRTSHPLTGIARPATAARVIERVVNAFRVWKNRRDVYRLGAMSDHELSDIGLVRGDLHVAWSQRFDADPTATLGRLAEARAAGSLRAATERAARQVC